ncbi:ABC transporter ATP-binding protein [Desulfoplanes formicivorans]|uniref:Peptide ABC transporter ATP-binding protein n=1 Tax=Desulfoplanes formicivorans TaxID=1592317 RepID=A0A194AGK9_9BACT|nr:ABC transporter ATP-binding protein [Desulfoplanes formicivorans]GAU07914.1 peptide ABC transporter ATP-binding protein [Desulfoplanes formicivorans]
MGSLLHVNALSTHIFSSRGIAKPVDRVTLHLDEGKTLGIVGESGCGKSMLALSLMGIVPYPPAKVVGGEIFFKGRDLLKLSERAMQNIRGRDLAMIFQEPMTSLNPVFRVGDQIAETVRHHLGMSKKQGLDRAVSLLGQVGISSPERRIMDFPHQMSGGMRQRVMIAMALACNPSLLVADEPTTALDVTIQAQILKLIRSLRSEYGTSVILITHDLGVVAENCDHVAVMYAGIMMEMCTVGDLFADPLHPYTKGLMACVPRIDDTSGRKLATIPGVVPGLLDLPAGCPFSNRCNRVFDRCLAERPPRLFPLRGHMVRCWLYDR